MRRNSGEDNKRKAGKNVKKSRAAEDQLEVKSWKETSGKFETYPVFTELITKASHKNTILCNRFQISFVLERVIILQVAKQKTKRRLKVHIHPQIRWLYVQVFLWAKSSEFGLLWLSFKLFFFNSWPCLMSLQADTTNMVISVNTDWVANQRKADLKHFTLNRLQTEGLESISEATLVH